MAYTCNAGQDKCDFEVSLRYKAKAIFKKMKKWGELNDLIGPLFQS